MNTEKDVMEEKENNLGELVLTPELKLKELGEEGSDWKRWEGKEWVDIYYSPSTIEFGDDDEEDEYQSYPEVLYVVYDKSRNKVVHVGHDLDGFNEGMGGYYDDKLYEESVCVENFTEYIIETYGRKTKN